MKSIRDLYKVGKGPSSSHTMGPERAARIFKQENPDAERYEVTLYGSLALTGVGHGTDRVLSEVLAPDPDGDHLLDRRIPAICATRTRWTLPPTRERKSSRPCAWSPSAAAIS